MTRRVLVVLTLLGGCSAAPIPPPPAVTPPVPAELRSCPPTPAAVPIPKPPRTWDTVVAWGNASDAQRDATAHALEVCRARLIAVLRWVDVVRKNLSESEDRP
jgi:ABC-type transport system substrate-binding protein